MTAQARKSAGCPRGGAGFSLIELIVVIVISGILAAVIGSFIGGPIQGFFDQARRARLVDAAQLALVRMGRDLRGALPNSVRVSNGVLELLLTLDGERYRVEPPGGVDDLLDFTATDTKFSTFAPLYPPTPFAVPYHVTASLAIYPLRQGGPDAASRADPYDATSQVMTAPGIIDVRASATNAGEYTVTLPVAHQFPHDSPTHRVFLVSGPVSWLCDGNSLVRYDGYPAQATQPDSAATLSGLAGATRTLVAKDVQACQFQYSPGNLQRNAVAVVSIVLADAATPAERVRLIRQVHVDNTP